MSIITRLPTPSIWENACKEVERMQNPVAEYKHKTEADCLQDYNPAIHNPVFFSNRDTMSQKVSVDDNPLLEVDPAVIHPAIVGYSFVQRPPETPKTPPPPPPDMKTCSPPEYLEHYIFPYLLPSIEKMLEAAKEEKCFVWKRTKFNACDFLTEYLYNHNPHKPNRKQLSLPNIPFVASEWAENPRPPPPKSLVWSSEEATLVIQSFWRGYKVRCDDEVSELRQWQREWREENENVKEKVAEFWSGRIEDEDDRLAKKQNGDRTSTPREMSISPRDAAATPSSGAGASGVRSGTPIQSLGTPR